MSHLADRDLVSIDDLTPAEVGEVLSVAALLKRRPDLVHQFAVGKTLAMIFEKPSLRTRVTFEVAMTQMGGHAIYLQPSDIGLGTREPTRDVAQNLSRWVDAIMARTFAHQTVVDLAQFADVPVINALSDREHPCQALADFLTLSERCSPMKGRTLAYIGDGNNVAHSLLLTAAKLGVHMRLACPPGYAPAETVLTRAKTISEETRATITVTEDPTAAVTEADAIYTDVWTSMGQEAERVERLRAFAPYQVNAALMHHAKPDAIVLHCLPAHRGEEITAEVLEGPHSAVLDQAENRLHAQKAVLALVLGWTRG